MATKTKKRRRRRSPSTLSAHAPKRRRRRPLSAAPRRRRRRSMGDSGKSKKNLKGSMMNTLGGVGGGILYNSHRFLFTTGPIVKGVIGLGGGMALSYFGAPALGAGAAGAMTTDVMNSLFGGSLKDDIEYVDPSTLSDSGLMDDEGNAVAVDDSGNLYALNDEGNYEFIGDAYSLAENSDMQNVSMLPLYDGADPYASGMGSNQYALASGW